MVCRWCRADDGRGRIGDTRVFSSPYARSCRGLGQQYHPGNSLISVCAELSVVICDYWIGADFNLRMRGAVVMVGIRVSLGNF